MVSLVHVYLALFISTGCFCSCVEAFAREYIALISDVHKYFKTSTIFLIFSQSDRAFEERTILHLLCREWSQKGILTLVIDFLKLEERVTFYRKRILRPLVVVLLTGKRDIDAFVRNTANMIKSYPIWLVIFEGEPGSSICTYCNNPEANVFDVRFDTQMLVKCCEDPVLSEWWSHNKDHTERAAFAIWTESEGLKLLALKGLYERRSNVNGAELRIAIVPNTSQLVVDYGNNTIGGFFGDVLQELNRGLNFTITTILRRKTFGTWSSSKRKWSGVVGQLIKNNADLGVAEFTMTSRRLDVIDFTLPLLTAKSQLFLRKPNGSRVKWSAYAQAFTIGIWLTILIIVITTPILLAVIQLKESSIPLSHLIFQNYIYVIGIYCQQGLCEFPSETSLRIAYSSLFISALVLSTCYSASLTSYLAVSSATLPFTSLTGLIKDGSYKLIVYQDSSDYDFFATSNDSSLTKMMAIMKPKAELPGNAEDVWNQVCEERVVLFTNDIMKQSARAHIKCEISEIETGRLDSLAMVMTANNQYTNVINYHIQRFLTNGVLNRLKHKHFHKNNPKTTTYDAVSLSGIAPVLLFLGCGVIIAVALLLFEQIYCSCLKSNVGKRPEGENTQKTLMLRWNKFRKKEQKLTRWNPQPHVHWKTDFYNNSSIGYWP